MAEAEFMVVLVTVGSRGEGETIARKLVEEGLVACVNVVGPIRSIYLWKGQVSEDEEHLLIIKTRDQVLGAVEERVGELHSYEVPEVVALPIVGGSAAYLEWLRASTTGVSSKS